MGCGYMRIAFFMVLSVIMQFARSVQQALSEVASKMEFAQLKGKQVDAILALIFGNDAFVILPTGYRKPLIYGVMPLLFDKLRG